MKVPKTFVPKKNLDKKTKEIVREDNTRSLEDLQKKVLDSFTKHEKFLEYDGHVINTPVINPFNQFFGMITIISIKKRRNQKEPYMPFIGLSFEYCRTVKVSKKTKGSNQGKCIIICPGEDRFPIVFEAESGTITQIALPSIEDLFLVREYPRAITEEAKIKGDKNIIDRIKIERHYEISLSLYLKGWKRYKAILNINHPNIEIALLEAHEKFSKLSQNYKTLEKHYEEFNESGWKKDEIVQSTEYEFEKEKLHQELIQEIRYVFEKNKIILSA